jgi:hypothetical protein
MRVEGSRPDVVAEATVEGPPRRRASWSLKTIVEDVAGRPIEELQDPERPVHPYLKGKIEPKGDGPDGGPAPDDGSYDPVDHLYPPLIGPSGRAYHGAAHEHHADTLEEHQRLASSRPGHRPGPSQAPERLYLHYLLLHIDRLNDSGLRYLRRAIDEELAHRGRPVSPLPSGAEAPETPAVGP